jgi:hypothetical protein
MKKTLMTLMILIIPALLISQPMDRPSRERPGEDRNPLGHIEKIKKMLNLTDEQVTKITGIISDNKKNTEKYKISIARYDLDIKEMLLEEKPALKKIESTILEKKKLEAKVEYAKIVMDTNIKASLNDEQKAKWDVMFKMMKRKRSTQGMSPNYKKRQGDKRRLPERK